MDRTNKSLFLLVSVITCLLLSCDQDRVYEKNIKIPDGIWSRHKPVHFEVYIEDTVSLHNLYINIRNTSMYPLRNLYLFIQTTAPSGHTLTDTVEVLLADEKGKWYGSGLGDMWDLSQLYKQNIRFAQEGKYSFSYEQAMRTDRLPFILDVGLRIEKNPDQ